MKFKRYLLFFFLAVVTAGVALRLLFLTTFTPRVSVVYSGTTNEPAGNILYCFQVSNSLKQEVTGCYTAEEVYHDGVWFNALPQPKSSWEWESNGVTYLGLPRLQPKGIMYFNVPTPKGRAEHGLVAQPDPPGEKWRACFSYTAPTYAASPFAPAISAVATSLGLRRKIQYKQYYAFSSGIPFSQGNPTQGANTNSSGAK